MRVWRNGRYRSGSSLRDLAAVRLANASNLTELASAQRALDVASEPVRVLSSDADIAAYVRELRNPK
jgi:hypothetical protein